jgi:hypothetical protein
LCHHFRHCWNIQSHISFAIEYVKFVLIFFRPVQAVIL